MRTRHRWRGQSPPALPSPRTLPESRLPPSRPIRNPEKRTPGEPSSRSVQWKPPARPSADLVLARQEPVLLDLDPQSRIAPAHDDIHRLPGVVPVDEDTGPRRRRFYGDALRRAVGHQRRAPGRRRQEQACYKSTSHHPLPCNAIVRPHGKRNYESRVCRKITKKTAAPPANPSQAAFVRSCFATLR